MFGFFLYLFISEFPRIILQALLLSSATSKYEANMWLFFHSVASSYIVFIQVSHKTTRSSSPCSLKAHEHKSKHTGFQRNGPNLDMECKRHTLRILKEELRILLLRIYTYIYSICVSLGIVSCANFIASCACYIFCFQM